MDNSSLHPNSDPFSNFWLLAFLQIPGITLVIVHDDLALIHDRALMAESQGATISGGELNLYMKVTRVLPVWITMIPYCILQSCITLNASAIK